MKTPPVLALLSFLFPCVLAAQEPAPDLILHHAKVVTVDDGFRVVEAVAIRAGRIVQVGSEAEVLKSKGPATELIDARGRMVIPGLIDSHVHPVGASLTEFDHAIPPMNSVHDVLAYVRARAAALKEGEWIILSQVFITRLQEQRYPTRAELDSAAPNHPVVFRTGPDAALNSRALKLSGIDRHFKLPEGSTGFAEMDPVTGEPTGVLRNCGSVVKAKSPARSATPAEQESRLRALFADYNEVGITGICDRDASLDGVSLYRTLRDKGGLSVRISCSQGVSPQGDLAKVQERIRSIGRDPLHTAGDEWLKIIGIKTYLDGGMLTGSAYMREPWGRSAIYGISDPAYRGVRFIAPERLLEVARTAVENGLQFTAHTQGDGAVHTLLDTYEQLAAQGLPVRATRCSLTHSSFMSEEAVQKAARLGVMVDLQPAWLYLDAATLVKQFGLERLRWFIPLRSLMGAGVNIGGGSDHMQKVGSLRSVNPYNPFLGMAVALERRARGLDAALHPEEALSREQALRFYTINNARLLFREKECGSIEVGKLADLAILDTDLLECPVELVAKTEVWRTYVGGKLVFNRGGK